MSVEAISSVIYENLELDEGVESHSELDQYLDSSYPGWRELCDISTVDRKEQVVKMLLTRAYFTRRKFRNFVNTNVPEKFWIEEEDDAKPNYLQGLIFPGSDGLGKEVITHNKMTIEAWEKIDPNNFKNVLDRIYTARSALVHQGNPLPSSIVLGLFRLVPAETLTDVMGKIKLSGDGSNIVDLEIPPLITFERLVSYCLVEYLRKQITAQ